MIFSDDELTTLLADMESDLVERKETWRGEAPKTARQAVCAFANDLPGHRRPGVTDYRNPNLADAMRVMGFVQRFGVGIQTARAALGHNGNPPLEYEVEPTTVLARIRRRP